MNKPSMLRKRFIPYEVVDISGDELLYRDETLLVTRWKAIKPRPDFSYGVSFTFLEEGFKISKFYDKDSSFLYWYCDIIETEYKKEEDLYIFNDLLIDIKLMPDGKLILLDADELAEALQKRLITADQACSALRIMDKLLKMVYGGIFPPEICKNNEYRVI